MAQLRRDYDEFLARGTEVVAIGPDDRSAFRDFWSKKSMPFVGLADPDHRVSDLYGQEVKPLRLGRLPALFVVDRSGKIRYKHFGRSMRDIVPNADVLAVLDSINSEAGADP